MFNKALLFTKITGKVVAQVACSRATTWYLTADGDLYGCGNGGSGQQGSGGTSNVTTFTKIASGVSQVAPGNGDGVTTWY